jgi:hypothetical protein
MALFGIYPFQQRDDDLHAKLPKMLATTSLLMTVLGFAIFLEVSTPHGNLLFVIKQFQTSGLAIKS